MLSFNWPRLPGWTDVRTCLRVLALYPCRSPRKGQTCVVVMTAGKEVKKKKKKKRRSTSVITQLGLGSARVEIVLLHVLVWVGRVWDGEAESKQSYVCSKA